MNKEDILNRIKMARIQRMLNNFYSMDVIGHITNIWTHNDEFIFSYEDHGVNRLTYFAKSWETVDILLEQIAGGSFYLEFMTKDPAEFIPKKAALVARMMRMANPDCRSVFEPQSVVLQYRDDKNISMATEDDVKKINSILWNTFSPEISHLLSDDEIKERLDQFTIHKNGEQIDAVLQADVMPKKFYINQIVNKGERKNIHAMLLDRLEKYVEAGGKYLYAWIDEKNIPSLKFHAKYGMEHDGMWSVIYNLER